MNDLRRKNLREHSAFTTTPEGWTDTTIGDICNLGRGRVISQEEINDNPGPYPVFSSQTRNNGQMGSLATFDLAGEFVTWTTDGENAGTVFFRSGQFNCTNVCGTLLPKNLAEIDLRFLTYHLGRVAKRYVSYIGNPKLMNGVMASVGLILPPPKVQRRIAEILSTLDEAIEQTEALIAKHRQIKAGLMHDLFTRGVTPDGHLRTTREQAPDLYKESPLGWIPKEWEVKSLDEHVRIVDCKHYTPEFQTEGYAFVRPRNVKMDGLEWGGVDYVSVEDFRLLTDVYEPQRGDIVFSRNASFGVPCYVDTDMQFAIGQDVVIMTKKGSETRYVFYALTTPITAEQIAKVSAGSTFGRINLGEIRKLLIHRADEEEQRRITDRLVTCDVLMQNLKIDLVKLHQMKLGLMHDLLTGRVRVHPHPSPLPEGEGKKEKLEATS